MTKNLELHKTYSREDVHDIFSPDTPFTPSAGTWGIQGIVDVPDRIGDYVFLVTFGRSQGAHEFDEFITEDGVLAWQSQPSQGLNNRRIQDFINHDEFTNNIHLFLRTDSNRDYLYFGCLKYQYHDPDREKPVYFQWQILNWPIHPAIVINNGINLVPNEIGVGEAPQSLEQKPSNELSFVPPPTPKSKRVKATKGKRTERPDYIKNHEENQRLGLLGEKLVIRKEAEQLIAKGLPHLADKIRHVSVIENDMAGYDVLSYNPDGSKRHIEVKTTRGGINADFFLSANEISFASQNADSYHIYRVFNYDDESNTGQCYVLSGNPTLSAGITLTPTAFKATIKHKASENEA